jgi:putative ABC transport system permease protein
MFLTQEHISYIIKDLNYRGIIADVVQDELIDHVCSATEKEMESGKRFIDAYHYVLKSFGHTNGLRETQKQVIQVENRKPKNMLQNYLNIAMRNLIKHRFYTLINVTGLAIGVASCLIITLYIMYEFSYDKHFAGSEKIYRVDSEIMFNGNHYTLAVMPAPAAAVLQKDFPEVESSVRFRQWGWRRVKRDVESIKEQYTVYGSNGFLKVFGIPLLKGNATNALSEPNTLIMSRSKADKYFPNEDALGQTLIIDNTDAYKVTGVFEDFPANTHFKFDFVMSIEGLEEAKNNNWLSNNFNTYIRLKEGASAKDLEAKFPKMVETYIGPQVKSVFGEDFSMDKFRDKGNKLVYTLRPLADIHLHSDLTAEFSANSDITYVYLFGAIAFFILMIACINFMNLSTARSANRAKEVGVRKVLGSLRTHLVRQFLTESVMLSIPSFLIALALAYLLLPAFNSLAQRELAIPLANPAFWGILIASALSIGLLAGTYPSFFLSAFKPVHVLKGNVARGMKSGIIRSALVIFQFVISIFLVIGTITVQKQLAFIQNKKLGFQKDQVIVLHNTELLGTKKEALKNELTKSSLITNVSVSGYLPIAGWGRNDMSFWPQGAQPTQDNMISMQYWRVDHDYIPTLNMEMVSGRNFSKEFPSDSNAMVVNEAAVKRFGFKDPIGEKITTFGFKNGTIDQENLESFTIVGVVQDFHFESLRQNITPLCMQLGESGWSTLIRFQSKDTKQVIDHVEKTWKVLAGGEPFEYTFMDEAFGNMYTAEQRLGQVFGIFAALAIIIACLGLFALTAFTAEQRTKEIGIRKVLGASVQGIVMLLSKEFGKLILVAFVLAAPIAWFAVDWWLKNYTYKVEIGLMVYVLAGLAAFAIAWITMSFQSYKAATNDPVKSLRSE